MRKLIIGIVLFTLILISAILIFQNKIAQWYLDKSIAAHITNEQHLEYQKLDVNLLARKIEINQIAYSDQNKGIDFSAHKIAVKGVSIFRLLFSKNYRLDSLIVEKPILTYQKQTTNNQNQGDSKEKPSILIQHIRMKDGNFEVELDSSKTLSINHLNLLFSNLTLYPKKGNILFVYDSFEGKLESLLFSSPQNQLSISTISLDSKTQLIIEEVNFKNKSQNIRMATDLSMDFHHLTFTVNFDSLVYAKRLYADSITIDSFNIIAIGNQVYPNRTEHSSWQVIESINKIKELQYLGKLSLNNGLIKYEDYSPSGEKINSIYFNELTATLTDINKNTLEDSIIKLSIQTKFMDVCDLNLGIDFNLNSTTEEQHIQGRIKAFEPSRLNPLFLKMANAQIKSGYIDYFAFNFYLNEIESNGDLDMRYQDLKIEFPNEKQKTKINFGFAKEFIANTLALNNDNKMKDNLMVGKIHFQREKEKSVFNYWWKSLASGITDVVLKPSIKNKK